MATYNVEHSKHATLVLTVVDTVNLSALHSSVRVTNRSALGPIYARVDGTNPGVADDDTYIIPNGTEKIIAVPYPDACSIELVCGAAAQYSVEGI